MIVVADASPLNYLIQINCDTILPELYERVFVPATVIEELRHTIAPLRLPGCIKCLNGSKCVWSA